MGLGSSQDIHLQLIVKLYQYLIGLGINISVIRSIGHEVTNGHKATDCHVTQNMAVTW